MKNLLLKNTEVLRLFILKEILSRETETLITIVAHFGLTF